ncbi:hypothetical protein [Anaerocolumna sp. MB42-C2]|uniref:hypothetical protein n=1 Tax=Anaerocolumna sp. MB42-C2 TaxID=3070997 RepID=UPI0027E1DC04|nr:hypothetical protein [Anaerocolumna sp. MB42-C2]WMJ88856.1 hypothetical protein RBU59_04885 [Anaerocolumna sp. MB42-C2]
MYEVGIEASEDISQEEIDGLKNLYDTPVGTIPMEREKGLDMSFLSMPPDMAKNLFSVEVIKKTRLYLDLEVTDIEFISVEAGKLVAKVVVSRGE